VSARWYVGYTLLRSGLIAGLVATSPFITGCGDDSAKLQFLRDRAYDCVVHIIHDDGQEPDRAWAICGGAGSEPQYKRGSREDKAIRRGANDALRCERRWSGTSSDWYRKCVFWRTRESFPQSPSHT
jgi:hypothetical protein